MVLSRLVLTLLLILAVLPASAEPIPDYVLNKDYDSCMGGTSPVQDPERDHYCNCIRDRMKSWDLDTYGNVANEQSKAGGKATDKIQELAQECMAQVIK